MLELKNITKHYKVADNVTPVLKGVSFTLRDSEFVSVLGPSGCGKTTMLNIIGGLDKYTTGDLLINGKSTKDYNDRDWDTYRSKTIGFVFQSYNLIPHQSVLKNLELALSIGNFPKRERKRLAIQALEQVGLKDHIHKKPNQLSGGQCQRVSIARALVKNPDIILADEPTGALDTETSIQIMELLKEISKDRLVLMVTHNPDLAARYSTRTVTMLDGVITSDTNPVTEEEYETLLKEAQGKEAAMSPVEKKRSAKKSSMSLASAIKLSFSNLLTKKGRTIITSVACSIGIIGIAVILSVSNGMQSYIATVQRDSASSNYIRISNSSFAYSGTSSNGTLVEYPENTTGVYPYSPVNVYDYMKPQYLTEEYVNYLETNLRSESEDKNYVLGISYSRETALNLLTENNGEYSVVKTTSGSAMSSTAIWSEILDNPEYIATQYEVLYGSGIPTKYNEVVLVVDKYNRISTDVLDALGIPYSEDSTAKEYAEISCATLINKEFKLLSNDDFYVSSDIGDYRQFHSISLDTAAKENAYNHKGETVKIVSVLRQKSNASNDWIDTGIGYTQALTKHVIDINKDSEIVRYQKAHPEYDVLTGKLFFSVTAANAYENNLLLLGATSTPTTINIYPKNFEAKSKIIEVLDNWNNTVVYEKYGYEKDGDGNEIAEQYKINYVDVSALVTSMLSNIINIITKALIAFSVVSLIVSSIMIAIVTYASVVERIKEIGTIRSLGGRKRDVSRVFVSEASMIGAVSAVIALAVTLLINTFINLILKVAVGVSSIATLGFVTALEMFLLAVGLNLVASLIPARIAAKKDPVVALRTE